MTATQPSECTNMLHHIRIIIHFRNLVRGRTSNINLMSWILAINITHSYRQHQTYRCVIGKFSAIRTLAFLMEINK